MQELNVALAKNLGIFFDQIKLDVEKGIEDFLLNNKSLSLENI